MKKVIVLSIVVILFSASFVSADVVRGINIDFVTIGNAGNAADTMVMTNDSTTNYGSVGYNYRVGKYEITNAQWDAFVAISGIPVGNPAYAYDQITPFTGAQQPTDNVSWYEAVQFCNYLTSGDKSKGAYLFSGNNINPGTFLGINRDAAISAYGTIYAIPTEDEWYKAAYYTGSGYSLYANGTSTAPIVGVDSNYGPWNQPWTVGSGKIEQNGTFDMMGNVDEWNQTLIGLNGGIIRGGSGGEDYSYGLRSSYRYNYSLDTEHFAIGFRIVSIPEPCTLLLLGVGGVLLRRKR